jgi:hypothetical protein
VVEDKYKRVANFHREMIENLLELLAVSGLSSLEELEPRHINHRVSGTVIKNYAELYPGITDRCLLSDDNIPDDWKKDWNSASANHW